MGNLQTSIQSAALKTEMGAWIQAACFGEMMHM